jgi:hypothetical protein
MREVAKSVVTLPWAMSMFGVQQMANLIAPPSGGRTQGATEAFETVAKAAESHLDGWLKKTYSVGDGIQRGVIDVMTLRPPQIDSSILMRMASEMQGGALFNFGVNYMLPPVAWMSTFANASTDVPGVQQEFANKIYIITLVTAVESQLGLDPTVHVPLPMLVARAERFATFPRLWAVEGLGNYYAERAWDRFKDSDPVELLTDSSTTSLPPYSLTMLHAGIGMSFANRLLRTLTAESTPEEIRAVILRFGQLVRRSSRPGYAGAALESLGLATRTLYPHLMKVIDPHLPSTDPELQSYFWHGAGRAIYFGPTTMLPAFNAPWRAMKEISEAPHETAHLNLLSGFSWAITVVNMKNPLVMEAFLRHHAPTLSSSTAFSNGVTSAMLMRFDTTPDDQNIHPFVRHMPNESEPNVVAAWESLIMRPSTVALTETYPKLRQNSRLEDLFHYMPGPA